MPAELIRDLLIKDIYDSNPQTISNQYPLIYPLASSVPNYITSSLSTLLLGSSGQDLSKYILAEYGQADIPAMAAIIIQTTEMYESIKYNGAIQNDQPGAETAIVDIFVKNVRTTTSVSLVKLISLRIRYLLDQNLRQFRGLPPDLPVDPSVDSSINPNDYFKCFIKMLGQLTPTGWTSRYEINYIRSYPISDYI